MCSKLLCGLLLCLLFSKISFVRGHPTNRSEVFYLQKFIVQDESPYYLEDGQLSSIYSLDADHNGLCNLNPFSNLRSPGVLVLDLVVDPPVKCVGVIEAPVGMNVLIHGFNYDIKSKVEFPSNSKKSRYIDALNVSIYDGDRVDESKRLYKIGDEKLENVKSTKRNITLSIDINKRSDKYSAQSVSVYFVYV